MFFFYYCRLHNLLGRKKQPCDGVHWSLLIGHQPFGFTDFLHDGHWRNLQKSNSSINHCKLFKHKLPWPKVMCCVPVLTFIQKTHETLWSKSWSCYGFNLPIGHFCDSPWRSENNDVWSVSKEFYSDSLHFGPAQQLTVWSNQHIKLRERLWKRTFLSVKLPYYRYV